MNLGRRIPTTQLALRAAVVVAALAALGCTQAAGSSAPLFEVAIVVCALLCAWSPDSHLPAVLTLLIAAHWVAAVDDVASPWAVGAGMSIALLHLSAAATSAGPRSAEWTRATATRWGRRLGLLVAATVPAWLLVALADRADVASSSVLVTTALLAVAFGLLWMTGNLRRS